MLNVVSEDIQLFSSYENWLITHHFKCWLLVFQNPVPWPQIVQSEIILMAVSLMVFLIGCAAFQARDIQS